MQPKRKLPDETIAFRQLLAALVICIPVGFIATGAGLLLLRHAIDPGAFWSWSFVGWLIHCLEFGILGGLGLTSAVFAFLGRRHYRLGYHRCIYCGRTLQGIGQHCPCPVVTQLTQVHTSTADRTVA